MTIEEIIFTEFFLISLGLFGMFGIMMYLRDIYKCVASIEKTLTYKEVGEAP